MGSQVLPINLIQGDKVDSNTDYLDALPVNVSGVVKKILKADGYMLQLPGLTSYSTVFPTVGGPPSRGGVWNERMQRLFRCNADQFYQVDPDGVASNRNSITSGNQQVSMPYSFNTQAIIASGNYYLYDPTGGFRQVTDPDLGNPIDGCWIDAYYFFTDGEFLFHTDLNDEEAIDPLKFATSEYSPDPTLGVGTTPDNKVLAINRYTIETFINQANDNFAFSRLPSRTVTAGIVGTHAKVRIDQDNQYGNGTWFCLGGGKNSDVTVYALGVGTTSPLGSRAVNKLINQYTEAALANVSLECRTIDNYPYLIVHLPNETLIFNFKVAEFAGIDQAWSLLESADGVPYRAINGVLDPRRAQWTYGDKYSNILTYLDPSVATHAGELVECSLYTPFVYLETASIDELDIETIPGFTTVDDATVFISMTYNGVVWSMEHSLSYGAPSAYNQRFIAYRLGNVDNFFAFKFRWLSSSRMAFATATITYG